MGNSALGAAHVSRVWEVDGHTVLLRTTPTLAMDVYVDGAEVHREARKTTGVHTESRYNFRLEGRRVMLRVLGSSSDKSPWILTVEGSVIPDSLQVWI
jgi:hypothetical protein